MSSSCESLVAAMATERRAEEGKNAVLVEGAVGAAEANRFERRDDDWRVVPRATAWRAINSEGRYGVGREGERWMARESRAAKREGGGEAEGKRRRSERARFVVFDFFSSRLSNARLHFAHLFFRRFVVSPLRFLPPKASKWLRPASPSGSARVTSSPRSRRSPGPPRGRG